VTALYVRKAGSDANGGTSPAVRSTGTDGVSASNTTLTSASAAWTSADVGHYVQVNTTTVSIRKIVAVPDAHTLTLGSALGTTQTGRTWTVGGAFLTLQKAVFDLKTVNGAPVSIAGDAVYVGPGDYRSDAWTVGASPGQVGTVVVQGDYDGSHTGDSPGEVQLGAADLRNATALEFRNVSFNPGGAKGVTVGNGTAGNIFRFIDCAFLKSSIGTTTVNAERGNFNVLLAASAKSVGEILLDRCYFWTTGAGNIPDIYINYSVSGTTTEFSLGMTVRNCMFLSLAPSGVPRILLASSNGSTGTDSAVKLSDLTVTHCTFMMGDLSSNILATLSASGKVTGVPTRNWKLFYNVGMVGGGATAVFLNMTSGQVTENNNVWLSHGASAPAIGTNVTAGGNTSLLGVNNPGPFFAFGHERTFGAQPLQFGTPFDAVGGLGKAAEGVVAPAGEDLTRSSRPSSAKVTVTSGALELPSAAREASTIRTGSYSLRFDQGGSRDFLLPVGAAATTVRVYARYDSNYAAFKYGNQVAPIQDVLGPYVNVAVHPGGKWILAVSGNVTLQVYSLDPSTGQMGRRSPDPATLAGGVQGACAWSPDGTYLAVCFSGSPYVQVFPFDAATGAVGAAASNPATLPTGVAHSVAWSPAGDYIAVSHNTSPYVSVYPWSGGAFGAKVADPATLPADTGGQVAWSPAGTYIAVAHTTTPFISVYPWSAGFGAKVADPGTLAGGNSLGLAWSPDGAYVGVIGRTTPFIVVWPFTTGFGAKVSDPGTLPGAPADYGGLSWLAGGNYIGVHTWTSPYIHFYPWSAGAFGTKVASPGTVLGGAGGGLGVIGKGKYVVSMNEFAAASAYSMYGYRFNHAPTMSVLGGTEIGVADDEAQMVGPSGAWEQISLTFTPTAAGFVTIRLAAPGSPGSTTGKAFFDDLSVT
jgi:WD40 repeat protein